jgi:proton-translocating NADH-quinone oxidoreductase chain L
MFDAVLLIPLLPLLASVTILLLGYPLLRQYSHWPCILAAAGSCALSVIILLAGEQVPARYYDWFKIGNVDVGFMLRVDGLAAVMLVTVTFVGMLIAIYSAGYMHADEGYPRYFALVSLFLFSMTGLVLASNFILLYAFWEGVGVCSYLLIGFWFTRPSAAAAARKAFLVTRIGDVGLFLGILLIWAGFQGPGPNNTVIYKSSFDYDTVFTVARERSQQAEKATTADELKQAAQWNNLLLAVCLLLFCGAVGKSAQFPLHVWLPDAMEGPSPVSALIHAATMVTAGVYLVARCMPLFGQSWQAQLVVACIGGFTALLAAIMALTQTDLKRVLAYSTVSQLGYMFLALGSGVKSQQLAPLAVTAAIFHLFTHAFFKALLFLGAGSVMHAMGNVIDMRRFGGLRRVLPITHWTFLCGAAALAGVPLLSGFWSKDEILAVTFEASAAEWSVRGVYGLLLIVGLVTAGLTAFYTFRAYFLTFWGEERIPPEAGHHAHESPPIMTIPLVLLAVGAVGVGIVAGNPWTHSYQDYLNDRWIRMALAGLRPLVVDAHHVNWPLMIGSSIIALGGIGVAYWMYVKQPGSADHLAKELPGAYELSRNRFYIDELYDIFIVKPLSGFTVFCRYFDLYVVDGLVDVLGQVPRLVGYLFRPLQNGLVQFYALMMVLGLAGFLLAVLLR